MLQLHSAGISKTSVSAGQGGKQLDGVGFAGLDGGCGLLARAGHLPCGSRSVDGVYAFAHGSAGIVFTKRVVLSLQQCEKYSMSFGPLISLVSRIEKCRITPSTK